jgi:Tfp pilus assembly protein PilN
MSTLTTERLATLPRVNLLPPEIEEARRFRKVQAGLGGAVLVAAAAVGLLTLSAAAAVSDAQGDLESSQARQRQLDQQTRQYDEVPAIFAQVDAGHAQLDQAMGQEVRWSYFLNDLSLKVPGKVWLTTMTVAQEVDPADPALAAASTTGTTYLNKGLGLVTFEGRGSTHNTVAAWLDALAKQ